MAKPKKKDKKKVEGLDNDELYALASELYRAKQQKKAFSAVERAADAAICEELARRGVRTEESVDFGFRITRTQRETTEYDDRGIWSDLTPRQRPKAFDRSVNLSALPADRRKELLKALNGLLTPAERKLVMVDRLNIEKLSQAVQDDAIPAEVVARHTTFTPQKAYATITPAGSE